MRDERRRHRHGWDKRVDADDPHELVMESVPGDREVMATCLIEEFARMGMSANEIFELFRSPGYRTHALYREWGEARLRELIDTVTARAGRMRLVVTYSENHGG